MAAANIVTTGGYFSADLICRSHHKPRRVRVMALTADGLKLMIASVRCPKCGAVMRREDGR